MNPTQPKEGGVKKGPAAAIKRGDWAIPALRGHVLSSQIRSEEGIRGGEGGSQIRSEDLGSCVRDNQGSVCGGRIEKKIPFFLFCSVFSSPPLGDSASHWDQCGSIGSVA